MWVALKQDPPNAAWSHLIDPQEQIAAPVDEPDDKRYRIL